MSQQIKKHEPQKVEVKRLDQGRPITAGERHTERAVALWKVQEMGGQMYRLARLVCGHVVGFPISSPDGRTIRMEVNLHCEECATGRPFDYRTAIEGRYSSARAKQMAMDELKRIDAVLRDAYMRTAKRAGIKGLEAGDGECPSDQK